MLSPRTEPTLLSALLRHWRLAAALILALCVLLVAMDLVREPRYVSSVDIVLREPSGGAGFDSERYANDQVNIMASPPVSNAAIDILKEPIVPESGTDGGRAAINVDFAQLTESREIIGDPFSNRVTVTYTAGDAATAVWAANSIVDAYDQTVRQTSIETARTVRDSFEDVLSEIERQLIEIDRAGVEASGLESERASLVAQQANILARISDLNVEAALNARPIALRPDVVEAERVSLVNARSLIALALLGIIMGTGIAYLLDRRSWAAMHPNGPTESAVLSRTPQLPALQSGAANGRASAAALPRSTDKAAQGAPTPAPAAPAASPLTSAPTAPVGLAPMPALVGATALTTPSTEARFAQPAVPARPLVVGSTGSSVTAGSSPMSGATPSGPPPIQRLKVLSSIDDIDATLSVIGSAGHQVVVLVSPVSSHQNSRAAARLAIAAARSNYDVGFVSTSAEPQVAQMFADLNPTPPPTDGSVWTIPVGGGSAVRVMNSMQSPASLTKFIRRMRSSLGDSAVGPALLVLDLGGLEFVSDGSAVAAEADAAILVLPHDGEAESERVYRRFLESKRAVVLGVVQYDGSVGSGEEVLLADDAAASALNGATSVTTLNGDNRGV